MTTHVTLRVEGPDGIRSIELLADGSRITVGRGAAASVSLRDDGKRLSREHLALRIHGDDTEVEVLPAAKFGVTVGTEAVEPGASVTVRHGLAIVLREHRLTVQAAAIETAPSQLRPPLGGRQSPNRSDDWSAETLPEPPSPAPEPSLMPRSPGMGQSETGGKAALIRRFLPTPAMPHVPASAPAREMDGHPPPPTRPQAATATAEPSDDWGLNSPPIGAPIRHRAADGAGDPATTPGESTSAAASPGSVPAPEWSAPAADAAPLVAIARGLGIEVPAEMSAEDWERFGRTIRLLVDGLRQVLVDRAKLRSELESPDLTRYFNLRPDNNPLKTNLDLTQLLVLLMQPTDPAKPFMEAQRAVTEAVRDLRRHYAAIIAAAQATVRAAIEEFDPSTLRSTLSAAKDKPPALGAVFGLIERTRLWAAYCEHYDHKRGEQGAHMVDWVAAVMKQHFGSAYFRTDQEMSEEHISIPLSIDSPPVEAAHVQQPPQ